MTSVDESRRVCFTILSVLLLLSTAAFGQETITLDFGSLPSTQGWAYVSDGANEGTIFSVSGGMLTQNTLAGPYTIEYYQRNDVIAPGQPFTISFRAKVIGESGQSGQNSYGFGILAFTGIEMFGIGIGTNRIEDANGVVLSYGIDNTQFHNYRLEVSPGAGFRFYVDDLLAGTGPPRPYTDEPNCLKLGDLTRGTGAQAEVTSYIFSQSTASCVPVPPGVVGWWPGDGNAKDIAGGHDGVLMNGADFGAGIVGQAFTFDGQNDFVMVPKAPDLDPGAQVTIEFWMNAFPGNDNYSCCQGLVATDFYDIEISNGMNFFVSTNSGGWFAETKFGGQAPVLTTGRWHHVAGTYDGSALQLYVDGRPSGPPWYNSGSVSPMLENSFLSIGSEDGRTTCGFCIGTRYFHGLIDEPAIYSRALTASEILGIYAAGTQGKCKELTVAIDIKPESSSNSINPRNKGVIAVAILTTPTFDATTVDPLSVEFGPGKAKESHGKGHLEDVNKDGITDLVLHFKTEESGIQCGQTDASLGGRTLSGQAIKGSDLIRTVGCGVGKDAASDENVPAFYTLEPNFPNPFNPATTIRYGLPQNTNVTLAVYNPLGQQVALLVHGEQAAGFHEVQFDGSGLASGVYFYRLSTGNFIQSKKFLLLK